MDITHYLVSKKPLLKKHLRMAQLDVLPEDFVKKSLKLTAMVFFASFFIIFFLVNKDGTTKILSPLIISLIVAKLNYDFSFKKITSKINRRGKNIDRDVLFAGRFLLIKLNSGKPLINAISESSQGFGDTTEYFRSIMRKIEMGTPLEEAIEEGSEYCPSKHLKKILFQISNALKIGIDVSDFLESILDEIAEEQLLEIVKYGKKLSSLTMFYMLAAIIVPSLGMTMLTIVISMMSIDMSMGIFLVIIFFLFIIQFIFITLFKAARPNMDV